MTKRVLEGIKTIFKTSQPVIIYTATGTGAWEAALTNTLSPGDRVLMVETGQFATLWKVMAERLGLKPEIIKTDWRVGADPKLIEEHLRKDKAHEIKAVCVLHSETATGCLSPIGEIRKASTPPAIRRCFWSIRSPRWLPPTIATTNGASMSRSAAHRRA
jgi:alanine-glyoxylate transaminase/serine-glyoxylate transaminase/serine-pyruvate transaminase